MKKLYIIVAFLLVSSSIFAQLNESFEGAVFPPTGWTKIMTDGGTGWRVDTVGSALNSWTGSGTVTAPTGGGNRVAAITYSDGGAAQNDSWLITPQITLTAGNTISFYAANLTPSYNDKIEVYVSTTTNQIGAFTTKIYENAILTDTYTKIYLNLAAYAGQPIYIGIRELVADNQTDGGYVCMDLFATESAPSFPDLTVQSLISPETGNGLTNAEVVKVLLKNVGYAAATGYTVSYQKGTLTPVSQVGNTSISIGDTMTFTFTTPVNFSAIGTDSIRVWVSLTSDLVKSNDTLAYTVVTNIAPNTLPMNMGFETTESLDGWILRNINAGGTWSIGSTASLAHGGTRYAAFNYNATVPGDDWLISNGISMTAGQNLNLSFYYRVRPGYPEKLNVYFMRTNEIKDTIIKLVDYPNINDTVYQHSVSSFTVPSTGIYYIGFHAYSDPDMWQLIIDDIAVGVGVNVNEINNDKNISIYPNPVKNELNITSASTLKSVRIINAVGQEIFEAKVIGNSYKVNTSSYKNGIYFVQIESEKGMNIKKFVVSE